MIKTFVRNPADVYDWIEKRPNDVKDYSNNWADWLAQAGNDTLLTSVWTVDTGITKNTAPPETFSPSGLTTVWLSAGSVGGGSELTGTGRAAYKVTNKVTTVGGRTAEDVFLVVVVDQ